MAEPISFATAAKHLRLGSDTSEQALVESYIKAAREWVENYTGHVLVQREFTDYRRDFGTYIELHRRPFVAEPAPEIAYTDTDGDAATVASFNVMNGAYPVRIFPAYSESWPAVRTNTLIAVAYTAGYTAGQEPQALLQAVLMLVGHWYSVRETVNVGNIVQEIPFAVTALCDQFRTPGL